jgi:hypothetical protein
MSWSQSVYSSRASSVSYDEETQEMIVTWKSGKSRATIYSGVSLEDAVALANAPSVGQMINQDFTGKYKHRNV